MTDTQTTKPLDEEKRRERDEPGTTGQDGSGDAGRNPAEIGCQHSDVGDKLGSRKIPNETEDDEAANKSEFVPSGK